MFDVLPIGALVIVAEIRQASLLSGEPHSETSAIFTSGTLRDVGAVALHLPIDALADVDDAIDKLRAASEVVLFAHAVRLHLSRMRSSCQRPFDHDLSFAHDFRGLAVARTLLRSGSIVHARWARKHDVPRSGLIEASDSCDRLGLSARADADCR